MTRQVNPADRRQFGRRQTNLQGWISVAGRPRLSCIVRDLSVGGALLEFEKPSWMPFNFKLTIEATRFVTWCEVRHHRANSVGVRFVEAVATTEVETLRAEGAARSLDDKGAWMGNQQ